MNVEEIYYLSLLKDIEELSRKIFGKIRFLSYDPRNNILVDGERLEEAILSVTNNEISGIIELSNQLEAMSGMVYESIKDRNLNKTIFTKSDEAKEWILKIISDVDDSVDRINHMSWELEEVKSQLLKRKSEFKEIYKIISNNSNQKS